MANDAPDEAGRGTPPRAVYSRMADVSGQAVQAGAVRGGIHFHGGRDGSRLPVPRQLPGDIPDFVNRSDEVHRLDELLSHRGAGTFVIVGTAGVGKTALAAHWAHRIKKRFPDGQLYANLRGFDPRSPATAEQVLDRFLKALGTAPEVVPVDPDERAGLYRSLLAEGRFLVVLDNASSAAQVRPLLAGAAECAVVVTSRNRLSGLVTRDGAHRVSLRTLSPAQSVALLRKVTTGQRAQDPAAELALLARLCARLPLALKIAAERAVTRPHTSLSELIQELQDESGRWEVLAMDDEQDTIGSVFAWSYKALPQEAARLFRVLGVLPGTDFSAQAAAAAANLPVTTARRLLDVLTGAHLLEQTGAERFEQHELLRAYAAELAQRQDTAADRAQILHRLLLWYLRSAHAAASLIGAQFPEPTWPSLAGGPARAFAGHGDAVRWYEEECANLTAAVKTAAAAGFHEIAWQLPLVLRRIHAFHGPVGEWIATAAIGLDVARDHGPDSAVADLSESLGMAHVQCHRTDTGREHHRRALEIRLATGDLFGQGSSYNCLGLVDLRERWFAEARSNFRRALELFRYLGDERGRGSLWGISRTPCSRPAPLRRRNRRRVARRRSTNGRATG
ncbi:NB-ARC domain-containing protein [Streptomonospora nanhaiensis]|uniref:NB-ARC domain-containing protein n=2 Tax=Streptomonospora nanhaiensis TaxID=1323731 RepID=UPI001C99F86C|nr:NB-ARC domain-containing protein [Streptomonospora nanhaiensis]